MRYGGTGDAGVGTVDGAIDELSLLFAEDTLVHLSSCWIVAFRGRDTTEEAVAQMMHLCLARHMADEYQQYSK